MIYKYGEVPQPPRGGIMNGWIKIQDAKPNEGELVFAYSKQDHNGIGEKYMIGRWREEENGLVHHSGWKYAFNWWLPLPYPPEEEP